MHSKSRQMNLYSRWLFRLITRDNLKKIIPNEFKIMGFYAFISIDLLKSLIDSFKLLIFS